MQCGHFFETFEAPCVWWSYGFDRVRLALPKSENSSCTIPANTQLNWWWHLGCFVFCVYRLVVRRAVDSLFLFSDDARWVVLKIKKNKYSIHQSIVIHPSIITFEANGWSSIISNKKTISNKKQQQTARSHRKWSNHCEIRSMTDILVISLRTFCRAYRWWFGYSKLVQV